MLTSSSAPDSKTLDVNSFLWQAICSFTYVFRSQLFVDMLKILELEIRLSESLPCNLSIYSTLSIEWTLPMVPSLLFRKLDQYLALQMLG